MARERWGLSPIFKRFPMIGSGYGPGGSRELWRPEMVKAKISVRTQAIKRKKVESSIACFIRSSKIEACEIYAERGWKEVLATINAGGSDKQRVVVPERGWKEVLATINAGGSDKQRVVVPVHPKLKHVKFMRWHNQCLRIFKDPFTRKKFKI
ncbi:hypothetical protein LXL04_026808 [Taraxacum kok-saghyz]